MSDRILAAPTLQPTATAVDRFVSPRQVNPEAGSLDGLARTLQKVNPDLQRFIANRYSDNSNREMAEGINAEAQVDPSVALEGNREGWKKMIASVRKQDAANGTNNAEGMEGASPHFRRGLVKARAQRIGLGVDNYLKAQWEANAGGIKTMDDPAAVSKWMAEQSKAYAESTGVLQIDPTITAEAFTPRLLQSQDAMTNAHMSYRAAERARAYRAEVAAHARVVATAFEQGLSQADGAAEIQSVVDEYIKNGGDPKKVNSAVMEELALAARETGDASILEVMDLINGGTGPIGNTRAGRKLKLDTAEKIEDDQWEDSERSWKIQERNDGILRDQIVTQGFEAVLADPDADLSQFLLDAASLNEPAIVTTLQSFQTANQAADRQIVIDHAYVSDIQSRIFDGSTPTQDLKLEIAQGVIDGRFTSATSGQMFDDMSRVKASEDLIRDSVVQSQLSDVERIVKGRFAASDDWGQRIGGEEPAREAKNAVADELMLFMEENPEASRAAVRVKSREIVDKVLRSTSFAQPAPEDITPNRPYGSLIEEYSVETVIAPQLRLAMQAIQENGYNPAEDRLPAALVEHLMKTGDVAVINTLAQTAGVSTKDFMQQQGMLE